jgi:hypothetical protein
MAGIPCVAPVNHDPVLFICGYGHQALANTQGRANQGQNERSERIRRRIQTADRQACCIGTTETVMEAITVVVTAALGRGRVHSGGGRWKGKWYKY